MPTIPEIKAQLKERGIKGTTGKNKAELMAMLGSATDAVPKRKRPQVAPEVPKRKRPQVAPAHKKPSPPPIIPAIIKKEMKNDLASEYDHHTYKLGPAFPIDSLIKRFKGLLYHYGKNNSIANEFLSDLIKWVKANSYEAMAFPFNDVRDKEKILLDDDWEYFFTVNK